MLKVGIIGATGYTGEELIEILLKHPKTKITYLAAKVERAQGICEIFPKFKNQIDLVCDNPDYKLAGETCELVFLALPHTVSMQVVNKLSSFDLRIIDLSADYRLKDTGVYEKFYKTKHQDETRIKSAIYGLPELYREKIKKAKLIANPGCYPTAAILGIAPALASGVIDPANIFIDAKSGMSGAGRKPSSESSPPEIEENFKAYKVNTHQHMPEIEAELSKVSGKKLSVNFVPHLLPMKRGILETIYLKKAENSNPKIQNLISLYKKFYKGEPFVRILDEGKFPEIKDVVNTNFCDIGIGFNEKRGTIVIISAIDNLLKGAAGQAVENMNIMYGFSEDMALV
jgi:N-acetyl-gamma-glutamyl-phosphate reductase